MSFGVGFGPAEWDYSKGNISAGSSGLGGWSYYLRAFDLLHEQPTNEVGWGQWSKPTWKDGDIAEACGVHPGGLLCDQESANIFQSESDDCLANHEACADPEDDSCPCLKNCGHPNFMQRRGCKKWVCGLADGGGIRGSIEGGMGYWMYTLSTPHVKYNLPGATNANYEVFGGTFLNDRPQMCSAQGGAVRLSNRLVVPNDFVTFNRKPDGRVDGFLGYMLTRSPLGKRGDADSSNYWTIVLDAANFAGPVMYMSAWFWDMRIKADPRSRSWSDPRHGIGYIAQGFEGRIGTFQAEDNDAVYHRVTEWAFPKDSGSGNTSTLFTGHSQYNDDWMVEALEPMLSGTGTVNERTPAFVRGKSSSKRMKPACNDYPDGSEAEAAFELETENEAIRFENMGVGRNTMNAEEKVAWKTSSESASCHMRLELDDTKLDCTSKPGWCVGAKYLKRNKVNNVSGAVPADAVAPAPKNALDAKVFEATRKNNGRFLGPPATTERACFECPGPAPQDSRLYCLRTMEKSWIGFRWYRFVDQPELNQVFASLKPSERDAAKCYMQQRIERMHAAQGNWNSESAWFDAPQGKDNLPAEKVEIDTNLLVTPPEGMEVGFVPIPVYQRLREKPADCEVVVNGASEVEPEPLPTNYWQQGTGDNVPREENSYDSEQCVANKENNKAHTYPGLIYQDFRKGADGQPEGFLVKVKTEVGIDLSKTSSVCGLASDPPEGTTGNSICGGSSSNSSIQPGGGSGGTTPSSSQPDDGVGSGGNTPSSQIENEKDEASGERKVGGALKHRVIIFAAVMLGCVSLLQ